MSIEAQAPPASRLPTTRTWTVDPHHSSVRFKVKHHAVATYHTGFGRFEGQYDAVARTLTGSAEVASIQTFEMLRERLFEEDFFDAERHPTISFASCSIQADGEALTVGGDLTIKGATKRVSAQGTISETSRVLRHDGTLHDHFGLDLELTIDRRGFGLSYNNELYDGRLNLGWDVRLELALELSAPMEGGAAEH